MELRERASGIAAAIVDGRPCRLDEARLAITDEGVSRGDGAFETIGVWDGAPFAVDEHLERLARSLHAIGLPPPDRATLAGEAALLATSAGGADAALRIYVTASGTRVLTLADPPGARAPRRLVSQPAPWIRPLGTYRPAGAKSMSYGPNMAAIRAAQRAGGDDALLVSLEGFVLEGPTFCLLWVRDGTVHTPTLDLGIVPSISRRHLLELATEAGHHVVEGRWPVDALDGADEVLICSSARDVVAVASVDDLAFSGPTPVRDALSAGLTARRRGR